MVKEIKSLEEMEKTFSEAGEKPVIVDFTAQWCGPCKAISPKFDIWAVQYPSIVFVKVDVDDAEDVALKYEINAMPTFKVFSNGKEVGQLIGASVDKLEELINKFK